MEIKTLFECGQPYFNSGSNWRRPAFCVAGWAEGGQGWNPWCAISFHTKEMGRVWAGEAHKEAQVGIAQGFGGDSAPLNKFR